VSIATQAEETRLVQSCVSANSPTPESLCLCLCPTLLSVRTMVVLQALNAWAMIDGTGIVHLQHKAHPTWCEDKFYRGGGDYWDVWEWAGAPGRKFAAGICADRGYIGDALYRDVAAKVRI
jgi:hypothetical protein